MLIYKLNADGTKTLVAVADQNESIEKYLPKVPDFKPRRFDPAMQSLENELRYCQANRECDKEYFDICIADLNDAILSLEVLQDEPYEPDMPKTEPLKLSGNSIVIPIDPPIEEKKTVKLNSWVTGHIEFVMPQIFTNETPIAEKMTAAMQLLEHMCELLQLKRATISASTDEGDLQRKEIGQ